MNKNHYLLSVLRQAKIDFFHRENYPMLLFGLQRCASIHQLGRQNLVEGMARLDLITS